ncbi:hypothetical protein DPMN_048600 [Dreissena polymorpha]|uniref:Uncharacterized protein n=1 Tax=Dreissena polymorpha TaxID=45954 RepID=A0A9D4DB52_DREPO|nr:hypothetical protein DPMN_048600 [Dreissena polymorpha]
MLNNVNNEINKCNKRQFVMATLVSTTELFDMDFSLLCDFQQHLKISCTDLQKSQIASKRIIRNKRTIFILNIFSQNQHTHGESRLLDPRGDIRSKMKINAAHADISVKDVDSYLEMMRQKFYFMYPENFKPSLVIFSYYVPCTCAKHNCALVVSEFSKKAKENVYVGYSDVISGTDEDLSVRLMESAGAQVIRPGDLYLSAIMNAHKEDLLVKAFPLPKSQHLTSMKQHACSTMDEVLSDNQLQSAAVNIIQPNDEYWDDIHLNTREGNFHRDALPPLKCEFLARMKHHQATANMKHHQSTAIMKHHQATTIMKDNNNEVPLKVISSIRLREQIIIKRLKRKQSKKRSKRLMLQMKLV